MLDEEFDYLFKIVITGDSGVGKTNLLSRFIDNSFSLDTKPTIGVEFATKTIQLQKDIIKTQIWDTAGQDRFRALTNAFYRGAQGAILVYDLTKPKSFENLSIWMSELREHALHDITIMVCGNKSDLEEKGVSAEEVENFMFENKLLYFQTSAKSGDNVEEAFSFLIKEIYTKIKAECQPETENKEEKKESKNSIENKPQPSIVLDEEMKKPKKRKQNCCK